MRKIIDNNKNLKDLDQRLRNEIVLTTSRKLKKVNCQTKVALTETEAAKVIQEFWRMHKVASHEFWRKHKVASQFFNSGTEFYKDLLDESKELDRLAYRMFGQYIAPPHYKNPMETFYQPVGSSYRRLDSLPDKEFKELISIYDPDEKQNYEYIPVMLLDSISLEEILDTYVSREKQNIKILKIDDSKLALLKIDRNKLQCLFKTLKEILSATGIVASPWHLSIAMAKIKKVKFNNNLNIEQSKVSNFSTDPITDLSKFKQSELMSKLANLAVRKKHPTANLAACLVKVINALPEEKVDNTILQRITLFCDNAILFCKNNYSRFAICVYAIFHEVALILYEAHNNNKFNIDYSAWKKEVFNNSIAYFNLPENKNEDNYKIIAAPAMSGSHAFVLAMKLAKNMKIRQNQNPTIRYIYPTYFEVNLFKENFNDSVNEIADIYLISAGPIVDTSGIVPGVDINKFLKKEIINNNNNELSKPVTILVDATTTLYQDLKLDNDVLKHVCAGNISAIVFESRQKFGLGHTDQIQYGSIFGFLGKNAYDEKIINEFENYVKRDLQNNFDMMVGAYIQMTCGKYLEEIKKQHFKNGCNFRSLLNLNDSNIITHENMLADLNKLYFLTFKDTSPFFNRVQNIFKHRQSFGHFNTTYSFFNRTMIRVAPSASDYIDNIIEVAALYLSNVTSNELIAILADYAIPYLENEDHRNIEQSFLTEEVILFGIILALIAQNYRSEKLIDDVIFKFSIQKILSSNRYLYDRQHYQAIQSFYQSIHSEKKPIPYESKLLQQKLQFVNTFQNENDVCMFYSIYQDFCKVNEKNYNNSGLYCYAAKLIVLSAGYWRLTQDPHNQTSLMKSFDSYVFTKHSDACQVIVILNSKALPYKEVLHLLLFKPEIADDFARLILLFEKEKLLNKDLLSALLENFDKIKSHHNEILKDDLCGCIFRVLFAFQFYNRFIWQAYLEDFYSNKMDKISEEIKNNIDIYKKAISENIINDVLLFLDSNNDSNQSIFSVQSDELFEKYNRAY